MSVNCVVTLPWRARVRDVAEVIGILAGLPAEKYSIAWSDAVFMKVPGVNVEGIATIPEMVRITITAQSGTLVDGEVSHSTYYHFEGESGPSTCPNSTPFWCAVMSEVVQFFGGTLYYSDCGEMKTPDVSAPERDAIHATDGAQWDAFQNRKLAVKPLTKKRINAYNKIAAY